MSIVEVAGSWDTEFEPLVAAFKSIFYAQSATPEQGAGFALFHQGKLVVDIYAGTYSQSEAEKTWQENTIVNVFSTTKGVAALCVAHLVERGLLEFSDKVAKHWPEFAANGKQDITIAQVLSHQSGLNAFEEPIAMEGLLDWDDCCQKLAAQAPFFPPGSRTCYQAVTFGFLVGEIVRRAAGVTLG